LLPSIYSDSSVLEFCITYANLRDEVVSKQQTDHLKADAVPKNVTRLVSLLLPALTLFCAATPVRSADLNLPDIGTQANVTISLEDEYRLGSMVMRGLRDQGQILDDPEINEYLQSIGSRLVGLAQTPGQKFQFFLVKDSEINAFALPGGFVGVNAGLLLATRSESELAGVLAHEISHVTQRHIARSIAAQSRNSIVSTAAMLAAILIGAAGGGDAAIAGLAAAQSVALNNQMSFSRANETEADNVGISLMARAGYDPNGMWQFFEVLQRQNGTVNEADIPAILRSHPVTVERIAETRSRAAGSGMHSVADSTSYGLMRERMRVLMTPAGESALQYYPARIQDEAHMDIARLYGKALADMNSNNAADAVRILTSLQSHNATVMQFHSALGQAQMANNDDKAAIATLAHARDLFPRNVPITVRYAEVLMRAGNPKLAHQVLLDLFNNVAPTPDQARLIAVAANAAGEVAEAYYYMAEYQLMSGDLSLAMSQLQMALAVPNVTPIQRSRFEARLEEIQRAMPRKGRGSLADEQTGSGGPARLIQ
jgi:predicted Zn-dependent protease